MKSTKSTTEKAKDIATDLADHAKTSAQLKADEAKAKVAARAETEADNVARAGDEFADNPYAQQAAEQISATLAQVAEAVRSTDLASLQSDATHFARRNPALFFGGAAVLGFVAARALKASERADFDPQDDYTYASEAGKKTTYANQTAGRWGYS